MKLTAIFDLGERRQALEDRVIECWQKRGYDLIASAEDGSVNVDLIGDHAVDVDRLRRSLDLDQSATSLTLTKGFVTEGSLFDLLQELLASETDGGHKPTVTYQKFYDLGLNSKLVKKLKNDRDSKLLEQFPYLSCSNVVSASRWSIGFGQPYKGVKYWPSIAASEEFGALVEQTVGSSQYWEGDTIKRQELKVGYATYAYKYFEEEVEWRSIVEIMRQIEERLYPSHKDCSEMLTLWGGTDIAYLAKRAEIINRLYSESALPADSIKFYFLKGYLQEYREMRNTVIGTVYEEAEMPLMLSSWKGVNFLAKRVFENGKFLIRLRLAGREDHCRTLLKEMEVELGVEIKVESCK